MRRKVQLLAVVALTCALVAGCGSEEPPPTAGDIRAAQDAFAYPLYWAGTKVDGLPLTSLITKHVAAPTVGYGICKASSDSGCALPVSIQTDSICERNALAHSRAASSSRHVRGVIARADGEGTIEIPTGVSNVTVFARPEHLERVLAALRPVADTSASAAARLPQPRYPFEYVDELRGVRDAYARTGRIRAVRDQPAISRRAVRFRLRLAEDWAPTGCAGRDASSPENRARSSRRGDDRHVDRIVTRAISARIRDMLAAMAARARLLLIAPMLALTLLVGCGGPSTDDVRDAQKRVTQPLYWAGEEVAGQPLTAITRSGGVVTMLYGDCKNEEREGGCAVPISVQTAPICNVKALVLDVRPTRSRTVRAVNARVRGASTLDLATGTSNVTVRADSPRRLERTLAALKPVEGASRAELPAPRYPLEYITELRRTRDAFIRRGSVRGAREELRISQRAIRFRLRLAERLGSARLRRPTDQFRGEPCPVEPAGWAG